MRPTIRLLTILAALAVGGRAEAQYGVGGYGFGFNFNQPPQEVTFLNQRSLINAQIAGSRAPTSLQAPTFQTRDEGIYDRYDLATRESMVNRIARDPGREMSTIDPTGALAASRRQAQAPAPRPSTPAQQGPSEPTTVNLANYFNRDQQLVWPSIAPISGDFGKKQATADLAVLAVLNEYDLRGLARLSTVTDARDKLLDYGRPALQYVRQNSTPALADSFHVFLLSIYGNLGNAATVPKPR